jgi:hypothetical protein
MNFQRMLQSYSALDYTLIVLFLFFIVFKIEIPEFLAKWIDSPIGMTVIFVFAIYMFFYTNPVLGVLALIVAYELLRRSSKKTGNYGIRQYLPSQQKRDIQLKKMNPAKTTTLEEEVISKMAPIGVSDPGMDILTTFKPAAEPIHNATSI